jgi:hypothetical protein
MARTALHLHCTALEWGEREESRRGGDARRLLSSPSRQEKNLLQPGCKPGRLQPLTKMRIDPTCRSIIQQKRYLVDLQVGPILISVRGCKRPGLQPGCNKFFSTLQRLSDTTHVGTSTKKSASATHGASARTEEREVERSAAVTGRPGALANR